ncbi:glycoside hydrolase family 5 protein [Rhizosaccharibacter radicis]|uniref:Glycoside hydrolase family 5 protein n=1 Tax=Rhizosaccharibacter radicis TaxID=2782605 RepID=A0ABT1W1F7_9PROT|nr:glycoside hydrolase family 5 protein [Acetobacteraceae bacterium KSS12]
MLRTQGAAIVDAGGHAFLPRGVNLGGWFVMEPFMSPMDASHRLRDSFSVMRVLQDRFGRQEQRRLMASYQRAWISDDDIAAIADAGFNIVRIPLWWGQFLDLDDPSPSGWRSDAFEILDRIVESCGRRGVRVVFDMHGAIGGQSDNPDTGQAGMNRFWSDPAAQSKTAWLWSRIAAHYRGNPAIAGYDLLNEPAPPPGIPARQAVLAVYDRFYRSVRAADPDHIVFIEDTFGSWSLDMLPDPRSRGWTDVVYEDHVYPWPRNRGDHSPSEYAGVLAQRVVADMSRHAAWDVPVYVGEFNALSTDPGPWRAMVDRFQGAGLGWSVWSWKSVNGAPLNFWGFLDPRRWPARPDPRTDDASTIARDWAGWTTAAAFTRNPAMMIGDR